MKKSIKQKQKAGTSSTNKKNARPFDAKKGGYKEEVYNKEEQDAYEKSDIKSNKKNTSGPKS